MNKFYCLGLVAAGMLSLSLNSRAQDGAGFNCNQHVEQNKYFSENPEAKAEYDRQQVVRDAAAKRIYDNRFNKDEKVYRIPVVFHVIHKNGEENISYAQCKNAVDVMNQEFNAKNPQFQNVVAAFKDRAADCKIEFRLATIDPQGNCTNGVTRHYDENTVGAGENVKAGRQWPREKYLNIYTCASIGSGAAGYAYYPGGAPVGGDGILIIHSYSGNIGTGSPGRQSALTHEVGHYLNLSHVWGNNNQPGDVAACADPNGDFVADTPKCTGSSQCNLNANTCGAGTQGDEIDNIQNFMEYAYCYAMFTNGQKARMRAALEGSASSRNNLWTDNNLIATGANYDTPSQALCKAEFGASTAEPICAGNSISFKDYSYNNPTSWSWSFPGGTPSTSASQNPTITYSTPGTYNVTLEVTNGNETRTTTQTNVVTVVPNNALSTPYTQSFESGLSSNLSPDFTIENPNGDATWVLSSTVGFASTKSAVIKARTITGTGKIDELISNTFDLSTMSKPHVKFKYANARKNANSTDELDVYVSTDCGLTWVKRKVIKGTALMTAPDVATGDFVPSGESQWKESDVSIEAYNKPGTKIRFQWITNGGNNTYIDNINIYDAATIGIEENLASSYGLSVFPNPTNDNATVSFILPATAKVDVTLYDIVGKKCQDLYSGTASAGQQELALNRDRLPNGVYFVRLDINGNSFTKKLVIQ